MRLGAVFAGRALLSAFASPQRAELDAEPQSDCFGWPGARALGAGFHSISINFPPDFHEISKDKAGKAEDLHGFHGLKVCVQESARRGGPAANTIGAEPEHMRKDEEDLLTYYFTDRFLSCLIYTYLYLYIIIKMYLYHALYIFI